MDRHFFCDNLPGAGADVALPEDEARHVCTVLRARPGDELTLLDGRGRRAPATVLAVAGGRRGGAVQCRLGAVETLPEPALKPILLVAPPRHKLMSQLVRQATELGLWELRPIMTERSVSRPDDGAVAGWRTDAREACKQSGNVWLPAIAPPATLTEALAAAAPPGYLGWVPDGATASAPSWDAGAIGGAGGRVCLWIGPEGGFTDAEAQAIVDAGFRPLVLGPWTLRVETAATAGLARLYMEHCR